MRPHSSIGAKSARQLPGKALRLSLLGLLTAGALAPVAHAATPIPFTGTYSQNFDTLPATGTFTFSAAGPYDVPQEGSTVAADNTVSNPLPGWQFQRGGGTGAATAPVLFKVDDGSQNSGSALSLGTTGATERALGTLASASLLPRIGAIFRNTSNTTYASVTLNYTGEQWRYGGSTTTSSLAFNYILTPTLPANIDGTATAAEPSLNFASIVNSGASGARDGNVAPNRTNPPINGTINFGGGGWAPGTYLVVRFDTVRVTSGSSNTLAVDDFSMTASAAAQPTNPALSSPTASPNNVEQGQQTLLSVRVTLGTNPASTGIRVTSDLTVIGGSATQPFFDDGTNGDAAAGDDIYSYRATVGQNATPGSPSIAVRVSDDQQRTDTLSIPLTVRAKTLPSTTLVIAEFRADGPGGPGGGSTAADEFVELLNISNAPIDLAGYSLTYSSPGGSTPSTNTITFGPTTIVPAGGRFLLAATGSSAESIANGTFRSFIGNTGGLGLNDATGALIDAAGLSVGTQLKEGNPISPLVTAPATQSYERRVFSANRQDTQDNATDFGVTDTANPQGLTPVTNNRAPVLNNQTYSAANGVAYSQQLAATDPDGDALTYAVTAGTLPPGLALDATRGLISGTPTTDGSFRFSVTVSDGRGGTIVARFIIIVASTPDAVGPNIARDAFQNPITRDQLAATTVTGTITDIATGTVTPSGVSRLLVQLRRDSDGFSYSGPTDGFTSNTNRGYYSATLGAPTPATTAGTRAFSRSLSFVPDEQTLVPGGYQLVYAGQDVAGNWSVVVVPFTIIAPTPAARFVPPSSSFSAKLG